MALFHLSVTQTKRSAGQSAIPSRKFIAETITLRELPTAQPVPMLRMADVELTSVDWLWFPYIPFGKLTIIQGNPGEGNANGYYHNADKEIVIKKGLSESQTLKTTIHETAHAKLHDKEIMESLGVEKDRLTKEVEAESVAYCVCSSFGLDTSDYSFPYIAGWSSSREMKEMKASMDVIRKTAGEMIDQLTEGIFVSDEIQSCGIGKLLLDYIKNKKVSLRLNVYQKNARAISFYQREGFIIQCEDLDEDTGEKEYTMLWKRK